jgi:hypothetical protein
METEAPQKILKLLFLRTSLKKISHEELNFTSFTTKTPNMSLNPLKLLSKTTTTYLVLVNKLLCVTPRLNEITTKSDKSANKASVLIHNL